jgi:hypothetical protein
MTSAVRADNYKVDQDPRLTPDEDAELRLLHSLKGFGAVARSIGARYESLRSRDRRKEIRDPDEVAVVQVVEKSAWSGQSAPTTPVIPAENPSEEFEPMTSEEPPQRRIVPGPQRTDTREVLAEEASERRRFFR